MTNIKVRALKTTQGEDVDVYAFFLPGNKISEVAQISRIQRDEDNNLEGFQRKEIKNHVKRIAEYLNTDNVLFPNAILLAMSSEVTFVGSRGPKPHDLVSPGTSGTLTIPVYEDGEPVAWIVDGQQRSLALQQTKNADIPVPVIAFISDSIDLQREQFVLVNKAKPLPSRLINELLPSIPTVSLPRDLAPRKIPSELCSILNQDPKSPFYKLIRQISNEDSESAIVVDTAIIEIISNSLNNPLGALAPYKTSNNGGPDIEKMYASLCLFWNEVKTTFPEAWGQPPTQSRLMHSAGIKAMGCYMDKILSRLVASPNQADEIQRTLTSLAPYCRWTEGTWEAIGLRWNEVENINKHIKLIADTLIQLDFKVQMAQ